MQYTGTGTSLQRENVCCRPRGQGMARIAQKNLRRQFRHQSENEIPPGTFPIPKYPPPLYCVQGERGCLACPSAWCHTRHTEATASDRCPDANTHALRRDCGVAAVAYPGGGVVWNGDSGPSAGGPNTSRQGMGLCGGGRGRAGRGLL